MTIDKQKLKAAALAIDEGNALEGPGADDAMIAFEGVATPSAILALLADIEMLTAQRLMHLRLNMSLRARRKVWVAACEKAEDELLDTLAVRNQLKSENEALLNAAVKVIEMNRQHADDQYGDPEKAESWSCVTLLRSAIAKDAK